MKTYLIYYPIFWLGYLLFRLTKQTQWYPYVSFRRLFVLTRGRSNDHMSELLSRNNPPYPLGPVQGVLGSMGQSELESIVKSINENGFYVFDSKLPADQVNALVQFAEKAEAELIPPGPGGEQGSVYDRNKLLSPRYQFAEKDVMANSLVQRLTADPTLFAVAQAYLRSKPIQDLTAMWWSTAYSREASSEAAQLFHFDMDRFKFIKFFFYLTDVDSHNGPHCYVRGSHKTIPTSIWRDGRIKDNEILENFPKEDILEIGGPKGTIIAVDTRGLHKGKVLERGERLILQLEYTNSLFGAPYEEIDLKASILPDVRRFFSDHSYSFQRFKI